jgi:hypothetical protein
MAQDRFINITLDANAASKPDRSNDSHRQALGASASGDLTISFDTSKFTSLSLFRSAVNAAVQQASGAMKP